METTSESAVSEVMMGVFRDGLHLWIPYWASPSPVTQAQREASLYGLLSTNHLLVSLTQQCKAPWDQPDLNPSYR